MVANSKPTLGNELRIPELYTGTIVDGRRQFRLVVDDGKSEFFPGKITATRGVNGAYLGPTLRMRRGDQVDLTVVNRLDEITTMHWHGMHVPARMDGTPHQPIEPGKPWTASFPIDQQAATLWYHSHPHGTTLPQVYSGIAGMLWIDDDNSESLNLPKTYGIDDIPVIIQDRNFANSGSFRFPQGGIGYGNTILINGTFDPFVAVDARQIRFRVLNASHGRILHIGFEDQRTFLQIATDGGLLEKPEVVKRVLLGPGDRAEILVDFSDGKVATLKSFPETRTGSVDFHLLSIRPKKSAQPATKIPGKIDSETTLNKIVRIAQDTAAKTRVITLGGGGGRGAANPVVDEGEQPAAPRRGPGLALPINGKLMDMHRIDERVRLGDTEIWELRNGTGQSHPFHVHVVQFQILDRNGRPPIGVDLGWNDVLLVHPGDRIRIIMRFDKYADPQTPYMYHCHILAHEDNGMMGQFLVVEEPKRLDLLKNRPTVVVFIMGLECPHCYEQIQLFDKRLADQRINLLVVTPESEPNQERRSKLGCQVISDPDNNWAGWFGLIHNGPAHGTLLVGSDGEVKWSSTEPTPFMDVGDLIQRIERLQTPIRGRLPLTR